MLKEPFVIPAELSASLGLIPQMTIYHSQDTAPLTRYLFRLQTEGTSKITLNGEVLLFKKGDLLLAQPGDTYELKIEENQDSGDYHLSVDGDWI